MKAIVTVIGKDRVGIIAGVSTALAGAGINILDISQTTMKDYFTMIMLVDLSAAKVPLRELQDMMTGVGDTMNLSIRVQHESLFKTMHEV